MKKSGLFVVLGLVATMAFTAQAATNAIPVTIKGSVSFDGPGKTAKASFDASHILSEIPGATALVVVLDDEAGIMSLQAVDADTNSVAVLAITSSLALLETSGALSADFAYGDCFFNTPNLVINLVGVGETNNSGDLNFTGKLAMADGLISKFSGKLVGVLNDSGCTGEPDRVLKGSLKSAGDGFDAFPFGL